MPAMQQSAEERAYREIVRDYLVIKERELKTKIQSLLSTKIPDGVALISFEIFSDAFYEGIPVYAYAVDNENTEVFFEQPFSGEVFPDDIGLFPRTHEDIEEQFSKKGLDTLEVATDELINWFGKCWLEAGGATFEAKAEIQHHDYNRSFDLKTGIWRK